MKEECYI